MNQLVENDAVCSLGFRKHDGVIGPGYTLRPSQSPSSPIAGFQGYGTKRIPALPPGPLENVSGKSGRLSEALERLGTDRFLGFSLRVVEILAAAVPFYSASRVRATIKESVQIHVPVKALRWRIDLVSAGDRHVQAVEPSVSSLALDVEVSHEG
jgi:hypothetical protein